MLLLLEGPEDANAEIPEPKPNLCVALGAQCDQQGAELLLI